MQRWQDSGVVEDSEAEDLELIAEDHSQTGPRKKQKLSQEQRDPEPEQRLFAAEQAQSADEEHVHDASRSRTTPPVATTNTLDAPVQSTQPCNINNNIEHEWFSNSTATTYGKRVKASRPGSRSSNTDLHRPTSSHAAIQDGNHVPLSDKDELQSDPHSHAVWAAQSTPIRSRTARPTTPPRQESIFPDIDTLLPQSPRFDQDEDGFSSGLSSPPSDAFNSPPSLLFQGFDSDVLLRVEDLRGTPLRRQADSSSHITNTRYISGARRNLRARQEKQLHPYLYDKAQYQQQWRARGLKPIHYYTTDKSLQQTQDDSFSEADSQRLRETGPYDSSPPPSALTLTAAPALLSASDGEMPDINTFLRQNAASSIHRARERQKTTHSNPLSATRGNSNTGGTSSAQPDRDIFEIPPSPPPTSSDSPPITSVKRPATTVFRLPGEKQTRQLPTPTVSSVARAPRFARSRSVARPSNEQATDPLGHRRSVHLIESSASEGSIGSEDSEAERKRLRREQKRIKGVLPASWLKIDLQARRPIEPLSPPPATHRQTSREPSPSRTGPTKGVAQKISGSRRHAPTVHRRLDLSESDASEGSNNNRPESTQAEGSRTAGNLAPATLPDFDDERMEADWIDPMLAGSSTRNRKLQKSQRKKRQPRITEAFAKEKRTASINLSEEQKASRHRLSNQSHSTKPRKSTAGSRKSRQRLPQRSILDVPRSPGSSEARPQFVRLAERIARRRSDHGRHPPSQKWIRLATKADTNDAQETLVAWKAGTIAPRTSVTTGRPPLDRSPLAAIDLTDDKDESGNHALQDITNIQHSRHSIQRKKPSTVGLGQIKPTITTSGGLKHRSRTGELRVGADVRERATAIRPRGHLQKRNVQYNGAQLEALEEIYDSEHRAAAFEKRIRSLTKSVVQHSSTARAIDAPQLDRYLHDEQPAPGVDVPARGDVQDHGYLVATTKPPTRPRKRQPRRIETEAVEYRQPVELLPPHEEASQPSSLTDPACGPSLQGLGRFGTQYAVDFDIRPLPLGTFFRQDTFIGSGDFAASLQVCQRDLSLPTGRIRIHINDEFVDAGPWTEETADAVARIPKIISTAVESLLTDAAESLAVLRANVDHMLRSLVRYSSKCVTFLDPLDRLACISTLRRVVQDLLESPLGTTNKPELLGSIRRLCFQYELVIANQLVQLCNDPLVPTRVTQEIRALRTSCASQLASDLVTSCLHELREFHEDIRETRRREKGITSGNAAPNSIVILYHCLSDSNAGDGGFWEVLNEALQVDSLHLSTVSAFDKIWYNLFVILPYLEIDTSGIAQLGSRFHHAQDNWLLVKRLLERLLRLYPNTAAQAGSTINDYVRATFSRCHTLVSRWGWWKAEPVLGPIYDFFTSRGLAPLEHEGNRGLPHFLTTIENGPSSELEPSDSAFTIFLKFLASALLNLRKHNVYTVRKIGGIAYRFIPNHGRMHSKEAEIKQTDLAALRNHFDLLCTLYFAIPQGYRPGIHLLRNLVELSVSHREVCRHSVRAWSCLLAFQASTDESIDALSCIAEWGQDMLENHIAQYKLAKTEAEQDFAAAKSKGIVSVTESMMNATITNNQRHIVATLIDNLIGIKRALKAAKNIATVTSLIRGIRFWDLFIPFDPTQRRLFAALEAALEVSNAALDAHRLLSVPSASQHTSDESQEYGDVSALEAFVESDVARQESADDVVSILHEALGQLLSNVIGADEAVDDDLLSKILDIWVRIASLNVDNGKREWMSYVQDYTRDAWSQLRDTAQRRKFTPYFLSRVVAAVETPSKDLRTSILTAWMVSIVEREASLKYQHLFTETLLNAAWEETLLYNVPFIQDARTGKHGISLHDFRRRRLSMISTVLASMNAIYDETMRQRPRHLTELRNVFHELLRKTMQSMKANYLELQASTETVANPHVQGAYVEFVQEVVTLLQQYTTDICRVDPFFTDSSAFPLPVNDPGYVVGRLRSYVPKLAESKTRKQLSVFIHTLCERAAIEGQQDYLVDQLCTAVKSTLERGSIAAPSLRHVLVTAIFPAYIEPALETKTSWILAVPILRATRQILGNFQYDIKMNEDSSVVGAVKIVSAALSSMAVPVERAVIHHGQLKGRHVFRTVSLAYEAARACLTVCDILAHTAAAFKNELEARLRSLYRGAKQLLSPSDEELEAIDFHTREQGQVVWSDTLSFARKQASEANSQQWAELEGSYFVRRGSISKQVDVSLGSEEEERMEMEASLTRFCRGYEAIQGRKPRRATPVDDMFADMMI